MQINAVTRNIQAFGNNAQPKKHVSGEEIVQDVASVQKAVSSVAKDPNKKGLILTLTSAAAVTAGAFGIGKIGGHAAAGAFKTAPEKLENLMKSAYDKSQEFALKLLDKKDKAGNPDKIATGAAQAIDFIGTGAKKLYGKISGGEAIKGFANVVGIATAAIKAPELLTSTDPNGRRKIEVKDASVLEDFSKDVKNVTGAVATVVNALT